jgi:opacity protein-like surface antigen
MKLRTLALVSLLLPTLASARDLSAGTLQLGGDTSLGFTMSSTDYGAGDVDTNTFDVGVSGLYYVIPNLSVGAFLDYVNQSIDFGDGESDISSTVIGPQVSYNLSLAEQLSGFGTLGLGYAKVEADDEDASGFAWQLGGGIRYYPVRAVSLDGSITYSNLSLEDDFDNEADHSDFRIGLGLSFYFGGNP